MVPVVYLSKRAHLYGQRVYCRGSQKTVNAFLGVPYARPPVGKLRFQAPQPAEMWDGERKATHYGPICPQDMDSSAKTHYPFPMPESVSEDCLYLNVWTLATDPAADPQPSQLRTVMFWIHGGSFIQGFSDSYDGTAFAALHNIVFVSINYRVGPLGFLATGDGVVPGNAGLLDQVAALKWVRRHISKFGGDPDNITVFGESAGAISISLHLCSPLTHGLFRRAICQSGSALHPGAVWPQQNARKYLLKKVEAMGCHETDSNKILTFLSGFSGQDLVKHLGGGFAPVLDNHYIPHTPAQLYKTMHHAPPVELLIGFNSHEGVQFIFSLSKSRTLSSVKHAYELLDTIIKKLHFRGSSVCEEIVQRVVAEYLQDAEIMTLEQLTEVLSHVYGDLLFVAPSVNIANIHAATSRTFMYRYCYRQSLSSQPDWVTADHGQEITMALGEPHLTRFPDVWSDKDKAMSTMLMAYWANFAKIGDPNGPDLMQWPEYTHEQGRYLQLEESPYIGTNFQKARMVFWNETIESLVLSAKQISKY